VRRFYLLIILGLFLIGATLGCNALRGVGKDMEDAGGHVQNVGK